MDIKVLVPNVRQVVLVQLEHPVNWEPIGRRCGADFEATDGRTNVVGHEHHGRTCTATYDWCRTAAKRLWASALAALLSRIG